MKKFAQALLAKWGYQLIRPNALTADMDSAFAPIHAAASAYSMTSPAALFSLYKAVQYLVGRGCDGAFVECGLWRGGSAMTVALTLQSLGAPARDLYLFDTFSGMTVPGKDDINIKSGKSAAYLLARDRDGRDSHLLAYATLPEVKANMARTGYPAERLHYIQGDVAETLPTADTGPVALLRIDTDWYDSTAACLTHLYPRLVPGGVLILDDYGSWAGARQAADEYFATVRAPVLLNRIDPGMRIAVKP